MASHQEPSQVEVLALGASLSSDQYDAMLCTATPLTNSSETLREPRLQANTSGATGYPHSLVRHPETQILDIRRPSTQRPCVSQDKQQLFHKH